MMKIGIFGTHGTGKTTLALFLASRYKMDYPHMKVSLLAETARQCPFPVNEGMTLKSQQWIFAEQLKKELCYSEISDILVCDRTLLDSLAYAQYAGFIDWVEDAFPMTMSHMKSYSVLVRCIPEEPLYPDGFRCSDPDFQMAVNSIFSLWAAIYGIEYITFSGQAYQEIYERTGSITEV